MGRGVVKRSYDFRAAGRAMRRLLAEPDDTGQVFRIIRGLSGDSFERLYQRMLAHPDGQRILGSDDNLLAVLCDRESLHAMPEGSFGRTYARFMDAERISADGLVAASEEQIDDTVFLDERARRLSQRLRDSHDLWHVLDGYGRDLLGEAGLLAFSYAQTRNPGIGFIVLVGAWKLRREGHAFAPRFVRDGYRRGKRAAPLALADWKVLLPLPLEDARRRLGIEPVPDYPRTYSAVAAATRATV